MHSGADIIGGFFFSFYLGFSKSWAHGAFARTTFIWRRWHKAALSAASLGGIAGARAFCSVYLKHDFLPDTLAHKLCSLCQSLRPLSLLVNTVSICFLFEFTLSHQTKTLFIWLRFFLSAMAKRKKKNKTTHSFLNSAQNITLSNLPLVNDNHKDEQNHQTEYKSTLFLFSIWSMRSSRCWSTHPIKPRWSLAFKPSPAAATFRKSRISKPCEVFLSKSHGSRYNFHFNDELGGN